MWYWFCIYSLHYWIFSQMHAKIFIGSSHRFFFPPEWLETNTSYKLARSPISQCSLFPPDGKMVARLCLLSCFYFVSICFCVFMCIYVILVFSLSSMFMTRYLGHYICHLMNKTGSSMTLWGNVPFNLSGYCCFEFRDSLKSLLKKIIVLLPCYYIDVSVRHI